MRAWVDTHVWRISIRPGLIGKKVTADAAHDLLQALLPRMPGSSPISIKLCCDTVSASVSMTDHAATNVL